MGMHYSVHVAYGCKLIKPIPEWFKRTMNEEPDAEELPDGWGFFYLESGEAAIVTNTHELYHELFSESSITELPPLHVEQDDVLKLMQWCTQRNLQVEPPKVMCIVDWY